MLTKVELSLALRHTSNDSIAAVILNTRDRGVICKRKKDRERERERERETGWSLVSSGPAVMKEFVLLRKQGVNCYGETLIAREAQRLERLINSLRSLLMDAYAHALHASPRPNVLHTPPRRIIRLFVKQRDASLSSPSRLR